MITFDNPSYPIWKAGFDAGVDESRAAIAELVGALKLCRDEFSGLPHSLGYDFTHLPVVDALITKHQQPTITEKESA